MMLGQPQSAARTVRPVVVLPRQVVDLRATPNQAEELFLQLRQVEELDLTRLEQELKPGTQRERIEVLMSSPLGPRYTYDSGILRSKHGILLALVTFNCINDRLTRTRRDWGGV